jgi:glutaredoxin
MVKKILTMKGHQYSEVNIDESPERHAEIMQISGQVRVPVTVVQDEASDNKTVIVGYNVGQLMPALV